MSLIRLDKVREKYKQQLTVNFAARADSITRTDSTKKYDVFLSHSFQDKSDVLLVKMMLEEFGLSVYIDWEQDKQLDRKAVTKHTASILKNRMKDSQVLIYLITPNSKNSKWMPWELGYFDGLNQNIRIAVMPLILDDTDYKGAEYLSLYPYIDKAKSTIGDQEYLWVNSIDTKGSYKLQNWIKNEHLANTK
ncbi:MAG: toll-Interleukin receptor [Gammaproteobacteria bacterium]|jgi:hypothetical protein|nr:toll-Interleukin receptor [Gammaproteobacteria bacterium]